MRLVIVESPFAGEIEANIEYARACLNDCLKRGESPIASHLLYTQPGVLRDTLPNERELGIKAGLAWRWVADCQVFYTERGWSGGMLAALHQALNEPRPIQIRAIYGQAKLPATLQEEVEDRLRTAVQHGIRI